MAIITICITKDDIVTSKIGNHIEVKVSAGLFINFTPEAMEELIKDYEELKKANVESAKG